MDIRANKKDTVKLKRLAKRYKCLIEITEDERADIPVIMVHTNHNVDGTPIESSLVQWTKGYKNVSSFVCYGYVRLIGNCPYRLGKCIGAKCSLYTIKNSTGDCAHKWCALK